MTVLDAIEGRPAEHVPVAPLITASYASKVYGISPYEYVLDSRKYADAQIYCKNLHGYDWVFAHQPFQGVSSWEKENAIAKRDHVILKLELGTEIRLPAKGAPQVVKPAITSKNQLNDLETPDPYTKERTAPLRYMLEKEDFVCGAVRSPFTMASSLLYNLENFLVDMKMDREFILKLLDFSSNYCRETARAMIEAGAHAIYIPDSSASSSVISPKDYREFALPYERPLIKEITKKVPVILHICGDISSILDDMISTGASCLSFDELTDIVEVHKKIPVWGNLPSALLARGTPEEVRKIAEDIVRLKERIVLSSGCVVPGNAKVENIKEMVKAAHG
jgi:MtaA/CmuA family methyltransferase